MSNFIKVTPRGECTPRIVLASLKGFYISQGAKIETPTDEEVYAVEPNERPTAEQIAHSAEQAIEIARLQNEVEETTKANADLTNTLATAEQTIAELREKLATTETKVAESKQTIADLRKEIAKAKKATEATSTTETVETTDTAETTDTTKE